MGEIVEETAEVEASTREVEGRGGTGPNKKLSAGSLAWKLGGVPGPSFGGWVEASDQQSIYTTL